jgi:hypothetical protein
MFYKICTFSFLLVFRHIFLFIPVSVGAIKEITLDVLAQGVGEVTVVAHIDADGTEGYFTRISMRTSLANFLIRKAPVQDLGQGLLIAQGLECILHGTVQLSEKFIRVLLLTEVDWLSMHSKMFPKATWDIQLQF